MFGLNSIAQHFNSAHLSRNMQIKGSSHTPNYLPQKLNALLPPCFPKPLTPSPQLPLLQQGADSTGCQGLPRNMKTGLTSRFIILSRVGHMLVNQVCILGIQGYNCISAHILLHLVTEFRLMQQESMSSNACSQLQAYPATQPTETGSPAPGLSRSFPCPAGHRAVSDAFP